MTKKNFVTEAGTGPGDATITRNECFACLREMFDNIQDIISAYNTLQHAHNMLATEVSMQKYIIGKFVPSTLLREAADEFKAYVDKEIALEEERISKEGDDGV